MNLYGEGIAWSGNTSYEGLKVEPLSFFVNITNNWKYLNGFSHLPSSL